MKFNSARLLKFRHTLRYIVLIPAFAVQLVSSAFAQNELTIAEAEEVVQAVSSALDEPSEAGDTEPALGEIENMEYAESESSDSEGEELQEEVSIDEFDKQVETTLFDLYIGEKLQGAVLASYTTTWLEVNDPQEVIEQLDELKGVDRLLPLFTGKIKKRKKIEGVGAVSFNLNTFSLIIDLNPDFFEASSLGLGKKVGKPVQALTIQQRVGVTAAGSLESGSNRAYSGRTLVSYGELFGLLEGAEVSDRPFEITQAVAGGIVDDYRVGAGLLQTQGNIFASSLQYAGFKLETEEDLFLDQDLIRGSRFELFVPTRSRVEFYRDGRLISVQNLDFGLQEINTTSFPQGSYDVDIVLTDSFGSVTQQRKFFTKSGLLASRAEPLIILEYGTIRDNRELLDTPVYQAGIRWRASDFFDLSSGVYGSEDLHIFSLATSGLYRDLRFGLGGSTSSDDDVGVDTNLGLTIFDINLSGSISRTLSGGTEAEIITPVEGEPFDPVFNLPNRQKALEFQDRNTQSFNIYRRFDDLSLRYARERSSGEGTPERYSRGPYLEWIIFDNQTETIRFQASALNTDRGRIDSAGFNYGYRISNQLNLAGQVVHRQGDESDESLFVAAINYDDKSRDLIGERIAGSTDLRNRKAAGESAITSLSNQVAVDSTNEYLQTVGFLRDTAITGDHNTSYGIGASSSFLVADNGSVAVSHPVAQESVFIAEILSNTTSAEFDLIQNGQLAGSIITGNKLVIGVSPYRNYKFEIRPTEGGDLVTYDTKPAQVTLFPGNVATKKWQVDKVFIILGQLVDQDGNPLGNHRIKGTNEYTATEADGSFQAEIGGSEILSVNGRGVNCTLQIDLRKIPSYFVDLGQVICIPNT